MTKSTIDDNQVKPAGIAISSASLGKQKRIPGEAEFWILLIGDLLVFTLLFLVYAFYRYNNLDQFQLDQASLNNNIGLINTLILLTSSLFVALGVLRVRNERAKASLFFLCGIALGASFIAVKVFEYGEKLSAGVEIGADNFFMLYFAMTGLHLAHVVAGLVALLFVWHMSKKEKTGKSVKVTECIALFWHMVDFLWIIIFALLYVIR